MRRINRSEDKEATITALIRDEDNNKKGVFPTKWQLLTFSAMLGYRNERKEKLKTISSGKGIDAETFMKDPCFEGVVNLFSLMESEDEQQLTSNTENDNQKISLFEEYANGGLAILKEQLETSNYQLDSVITLIAEELHKGPSVDDELDTIQI
jgi:dnd system-associated protein 4